MARDSDLLTRIFFCLCLSSIPALCSTKQGQVLYWVKCETKLKLAKNCVSRSFPPLLRPVYAHRGSDVVPLRMVMLMTVRISGICCEPVTADGSSWSQQRLQCLVGDLEGEATQQTRGRSKSSRAHTNNMVGKTCEKRQKTWSIVVIVTEVINWNQPL